MSSFTRTAFQNVGGKLDQLTLDQRTPPIVRKVYETVTDLAGRYASSVLSVQNQPGTAGAAAGAAGAGAVGGGNGNGGGASSATAGGNAGATQRR